MIYNALKNVKNVIKANPKLIGLSGDIYVYRSHYREDLAVVIYESKIYALKDDRHVSEGPFLAVRIQPAKFKECEEKIVNYRITITIPANITLANPKTVNDWEIMRKGKQIYAIKTEGYELLEINVISLDSSTKIQIRGANVNPAEHLEEILAVLKEIVNISEEDIKKIEYAVKNEERSEYTVFLIKPTSEMSDKDAKKALETELRWLSSVGVIKGLTEEDIREIISVAKVGYAGYNLRIIYCNGWKPASDCENFILVKALGTCDFSLRKIEIPNESAEIINQNSPGFEWIMAGVAFIIILALRRRLIK